MGRKKIQKKKEKSFFLEQLDRLERRSLQATKAVEGCII